jgi:hypothetical protein
MITSFALKVFSFVLKTIFSTYLIFLSSLSCFIHDSSPIVAAETAAELLRPPPICLFTFVALFKLHQFDGGQVANSN